MDSLLAYASSSDDEDDNIPQPQPQPSSKPYPSSLFSSLPKPQSSPSPSPSSTIFSSIPPPKKTPDFPKPTNTKRRVVQFHPPKLNKVDDFDDPDDDLPQRPNISHVGPSTPTGSGGVSSFLSTLPAPKSSFGSAPTSRRSVISTPAVSNDVGIGQIDQEVENNQVNVGTAGGSSDGGAHPQSEVYDNNNYYVGYESYDVQGQGEQQQQYYVGASSGSGSDNWNYDGSSGGSGYDGLGSGVGVESYVSMGGGGKRRRDQPPAEIVEVKQDELMKNRPTEDKSKLTGIAFGPSYQPASSKGKPSKLHKRKHQISALYFDMRSKEMELQERRAKGFLTKAETQAKYGW